MEEGGGVALSLHVVAVEPEVSTEGGDHLVEQLASVLVALGLREGWRDGQDPTRPAAGRLKARAW